MDQTLLFSKLDKFEKALVERRLRPGESSGDTPTGKIIAASDKLESNLISESPLCDYVESFVYPRSARNLKREWRFVVNLPGGDEQEDYVQTVKIQRCLREGEACNIEVSGFSSTICRQKYTYKKMLAINTNGTHYVDTFRFPSCCLCYRKDPYYNFKFELLKDRRED